MDGGRIKFSLEEILYYVFFSILIFTKGIGLDEGSILFRSCLLTAIFLLGCKFLLGQYSMIEIVFVGILGLWGAATFKITGSLGMFVYVLMIVGLKNIPVKRVFKVGAVVWGVCMLFTLTAAVFCGRTGVRLVHEKLGLGPVIRESLGYTHPNVLHVTYVVFMAFVLYLCKEKGKKSAWAILLLLLGDVFIFIYSLSYTGLLISFAYFICYFYFSFRKRITKTEKVLIQCILPVCVIISAILPPLLSDGIIYKLLNSLLNNRVWAIKAYYELYPVTLFGMKSEGITFSIDNSYVFALMNYGAVFLIAAVIVYWMLIRYCLKNEMRGELAIICTFLFAGLSEPFLFNASIKNVTVIFLGNYLYAKAGNKSGLRFWSAKNRSFEVRTDFLLNIKRQIELLNKRPIMVIVLAAGCAAFLYLCSKDCIKLEAVYADEKLCDCAGETVTLPNDIPKEGIMIIGEANAETNYYYFDRQNSRLIDIMDKRLKVSISLYAAMTAGVTALCVMLGRLNNRRDLPLHKNSDIID